MPDVGRAGAGAGAAIGLAIAAAGVACAAADVRDKWDEGGGTAAQALALHRRASALATAGALRYGAARAALDVRSADLGERLTASLVAPLALAGAAADLAELASEAVSHVRPEHRPEALAAVRVGAAAAAIAADVVAVNLTIVPGDERLAAARNDRTRAEAALRRAEPQ